ncbi:MAG: sigma-54-dependent Fis family transcriptional regulator [Gemmatimonadota bacterium]|nr:MAG: sigma-54-dependent Fis family transcriptional regulator [Gemmatimonadota bacterium]
MPHALLIDDDPGSLRALAEWVEQEGFQVQTAETLEQARAALLSHEPDLAIIDLYLPDGTGLELLDDLKESPHIQVLVVTGQGSINSAVEAMRGGAVDYLTKPIEPPRLRRILMGVQKSLELRREIDALRGELRSLGRFGEILGGSQSMQTIYDQIERVAPTDTTVLITGETGTGKEVAARTIHRLSLRASKAFLPINCGAMPPNLIESEIFGHERGSFTGAEGRRQGIFERADGGTLFLDEITEMPLELQVKLLRVLETGEVTRIGGSASQKVDVRVISATNRAPNEAVASGKLREDLLYRLNVFPLELPPLRNRGEDVRLLAQGFLDELNRRSGTSKRMTDPAYDRLRHHLWPGNVRELKNVVERAFIMALEEIGPDDVPIGPRRHGAPEGENLTFEVGTSLEQSEKALIIATLKHHEGNKREAAKVLGVSLKTLYNRLKDYGNEEEEEAARPDSARAGS